MKINPGTLPRKISNYNGKSIFLLFLNTDQNAPIFFFYNFNMDILISILLSELFLTWGSGQTENTQIGILAYFQFDHFLK